MSSDADRDEIERQIAAAQAKIQSGKPSESAKSREKRRRELKGAVVDPKRLRSSDRSQTTIAFRGSLSLKRRLQIQSAKMRASSGEKFNEWMERVLEAAIDADNSEPNGHA